MKFKRSIPLFFALLSAFAYGAFGQTPASTPPAEEQTVRISTELVQMDVVVLDKDGKPAKDLGASDFVLYQDGKEQKLVSVTFVDAVTGQKVRTSAGQLTKEERKITIPPSGMRSREGRIITFVIDDGNCLSSPAGSADIRDAVRRFIDEKMQPDDRVAIYRTAGGSSLLQIYTSNKEALKRAANRTQLLPTRGCGSSFQPLRDDSTIKITGQGAANFESEADKARRDEMNQRENRNQVIGTIGVMGFIVDRLKNLPQRKMIFLLSEGIATRYDDDSAEALRELADKAARSSVVIHTLSAKGNSVPGFLSAEDEVLPGIIGGPDNTTLAAEDRREEERRLNSGLRYLAYVTGGRFIRNANRLETGIEGIMNENAGYYLLAYEPDGEAFKGKSFHKIDVRVTKPELRILSRKGFFGRSDKESAPVYKTADSPIYQAIASPLQENGIDMRMTMLYGNTAAGGDHLRALFHVPGRDLTFTSEADGSKKTSLDVVGVLLDEKGKVIEEINRTYPIKIPKQGVGIVEANGMDFSTDIPIKKPGVYTFRMGIRDNVSKRLGTAGDFIVIPEFKKGDFFISGLLATGIKSDGTPQLASTRPINAAFAPVFSEEIPSIRRFQRGSLLSYTYTIYNARGGSANISREVRLYRNGTALETIPEAPVENASLVDTNRIADWGVIKITDMIAPGEYALQVIVRDKTEKKVSSQWIDFEVVP